MAGIALCKERNEFSRKTQCVKNGTDKAKSYADYVTKRTNNESAIAEIIEKFIL